MARRVGAFELRCDEAVLIAMLVHPTYGRRMQFVQAGLRQVHLGNWALAAYLSEEQARRALDAVLSRIVNKQLPTGLWFRKHAHDLSLRILRALHHAGIVGGASGTGPLRYDPFEPFRDRLDLPGLLARRNVFGRGSPKDDYLHATILADLRRQQRPNGSWGDTVAETSLQVECLLDLGLSGGDPCVGEAAGWLLGQFRPSLEVEHRLTKASWPLLVADTFTSLDLAAEWRGARAMLPYMVLTGACFLSLPIIQTALTLRVLVRLGLSRHPKVTRAYKGLLDMQLQPMGNGCGQWCAGRCRTEIERRAIAQRACDTPRQGAL